MKDILLQDQTHLESVDVIINTHKHSVAWGPLPNFSQ